MKIKEQAKRIKEVSSMISDTSEKTRNTILANIIEKLETNKDRIFKENQKDLDQASGLPSAIIKRLKFDRDKLESTVAGIRQLIELEDPLNKTLLKRELDKDFVLEKISVPIGVIGVIFEARPDALIQISSLCIKSGNAAILKGGKETAHTNKILFDLLYQSAIEGGFPEGSMMQVTEHSEIDELLECDKDVDLLIPRGSNQFVQYIMNHTRIPVMGHADGVCHIYIDKDYNNDLLMPILIDAKTQYSAACNSVETILINRSKATTVLPMIKKEFDKLGIKLFGDKEVNTIIPVELVEDYHKEYLDLIVSLKIVENVREAVIHINNYGSHHTDSIITENKETADYFIKHVDSAGVYLNVSTRFADGFRYGFGAEVGISTGKLHARGPVGLDGLVTYKYCLRGHGETVSDYVSGKKVFHYKNIL